MIIRTSYCNSFVLENFERASAKVKDACVPLLKYFVEDLPCIFF